MGKRARAYSDLSNLPTVRAELDGLDYLVWLATLDGDKLSHNFLGVGADSEAVPAPGTKTMKWS